MLTFMIENFLEMLITIGVMIMMPLIHMLCLLLALLLCMVEVSLGEIMVSAFRDRGGPLGRRVSVVACPSPDGSSEGEREGGRSEAAGDRRERGGNPASFVFVPRPGRVRLQ